MRTFSLISYDVAVSQVIAYTRYNANGCTMIVPTGSVCSPVE